MTGLRKTGQVNSLINLLIEKKLAFNLEEIQSLSGLQLRKKIKDLRGGEMSHHGSRL